MSYRKKLIEVALPLQKINSESSREKAIRHGHPSTLHRYWARRPLAAARAVLFSSLVDDPSNDSNLSESEKSSKRNELFGLISELIEWKNSDNIDLIEKAREYIVKSTGDRLPDVLDPFCGGGTIPLEAQRLGLNAFASDLNPVAVILTKAIIEIPFKFRNFRPVNPQAKERPDFDREWRNSTGIAEDVRFYGKEILRKAKEMIGALYPKENGLNVIGWLWARSVKCPNPACGDITPLVRSFVVSSRKGRKTKIEPKIESSFGKQKIKYEIIYAEDVASKGTVDRNGGICLICSAPIPFSYIRKEGRRGNISRELLAIIAEGDKGRLYFSPPDDFQDPDTDLIPQWEPEIDVPEKALGISVHAYGLTCHKDLYTKRQLILLNTLCDLIKKIHPQIRNDATRRNTKINNSLCSENSNDYANAIVTYLSLAVDRMANQHNTLTRWNPGGENIEGLFAMQTIEMKWEYIEGNPFCNSTGNFLGAINWIAKVLDRIYLNAPGFAFQMDASKNIAGSESPLVCTDPPYYDNVGYADLSDFFYVWLKKNLHEIYPELFKTILTPKSSEIIANPHRFNGNRKKAEEHFLSGMLAAAKNIAKIANADYPVIYFYAYKQTEVDDYGLVVSTGWETFLASLIKAGFQITATWPIRTEFTARARAAGSNTLASSIIVTLRKKKPGASIATRREFTDELRGKLEPEIIQMMEYDIAPVDLQQAAIGPGIAIYSKYGKVVEADGSPMTVRTALQLINAELDRIQESSDIVMDLETRFCVQWFDTYGYEEKPYGEAETLARAKDISVDGLVQSGIFISGRGKAKLRYWEDMPIDWDPRSDVRLTLWECTHHLIRVLMKGGGQMEAAKLARYMGNQKSEDAKELAYLLYYISDKRKWNKLAGDYNALATNWPEIKSLIPEISEEQPELF